MPRRASPVSSFIFPFPLRRRSIRSLLPTRNGLLTAIGAHVNVVTKRTTTMGMEKVIPSAAPTSSSSAHPNEPILSSHYYIGCLIIFGCLGNLICVVASRRSRALRRSRFNAYLIGCCSADSVFLVCLGIVWLKNVNVNWHDVNAVCIASTFVSNSSSFLSGWYAAAMILELSSTLRNPYRIYTLFTTRRLLFKRVMLLALISLLANTWTLGLTRTVRIPAGGGGPARSSMENAHDEETSMMMGTAVVELPEAIVYEEGEQLAADRTSGLVNETAIHRGNGFDDDVDLETEGSSVNVCHFDTEKEYVFRAFTIYEVLLSVAVPLTVAMTSVCVIGARFVSNRYCSSSSTTSDEKTTRGANASGATDMAPLNFDGLVFHHQHQNGTSSMGPTASGDSSTQLHPPPPATVAHTNDQTLDVSSPNQHQNRLYHFAVRTQPDADRERKVLIVAVPAAVALATNGGTGGAGSRSSMLLTKRRPRHLMSPARYHAMLHRRTLERCLRSEDSIRPLLIVKACTYVVCTFPHFIYRLSVLFGMKEAHQDAISIKPMIVIFMFYTQFALNAPMYGLLLCLRHLYEKKGK